MTAGRQREKTPRMKLHHLLQKCSFFLIKLAALVAGGRAEKRTAEPQNIE